MIATYPVIFYEEKEDGGYSAFCQTSIMQQRVERT